MLTPLFYLFFALPPGMSRNGNSSDIMGLCLRLPTWNALAAIRKFRSKRRKPFALYAVACFSCAMSQAWKKPGEKLIIAAWYYQGDTGRGGLLRLSNRRKHTAQGKSFRYNAVPLGHEAYFWRGEKCRFWKRKQSAVAKAVLIPYSIAVMYGLKAVPFR
jgi:hypothetical protein